jgi:hypothetical protein
MMGEVIPASKGIGYLNQIYVYAGDNPVMNTDKTGENVAIWLTLLIAAYGGYEYYSNIQEQEECENSCPNQCDDGDTSALTECKAKCVIKVWGAEPRMSPVVDGL